MDRHYSVYIMSSDSGTLYIGITNDLYRRVAQHKDGDFEGFSKKYGCHRLVYYEDFADVVHAITREKQLKGWRREKKIRLIESTNPRWQDLAEDWGREMAFANECLAGKR